MSEHDTSEDNGAQPAANAGSEPQDTEIAVTEAAELPPEAEPAQDATQKIRRNASTIASVLALACALFAAAAVGFLWWQNRLAYVGIEQAYSVTTASLEASRADVRALEEQLVDLVAGNLATRELAIDLGERVYALPARLLDFEERLNATQGVSGDARRRWLRGRARGPLDMVTNGSRSYKEPARRYSASARLESPASSKARPNSRCVRKFSGCAVTASITTFSLLLQNGVRQYVRSL